ncbi:hypothetical protein GX51_01776 [Blastomyces parvus]|uniref:ML-like domain-containing protein n=1 Tax=Blastomyces parvus TaxID=2060905 RepID=A0A2B7XEV7_9EURO|nr:hypothetical protein GX51_01776 [Blastomyces parvus]
MTLVSIYMRFFFLSFFLPLGQSSPVRRISHSGADERNKRNLTPLYDNRRPSLYTKDFGNCLGNSQIAVTRFDAALYMDNMTAVFNLHGNTSVENENLMSTYNFTILIPLNASTPISANIVIPLSESDISVIPAIAFKIPDFEGTAVLRLFANSSQSEIGCYSAASTNGITLGQPVAVGSILALFVVLGVISSTSLAIYGTDPASTRTHYAHSPSAFVSFSILHHIYFTSALAMNWPSVLVAFWSNFAWFSGMIYNEKMQASINQVIGTQRADTKRIGAQLVGVVGGTEGVGFNISNIYSQNASPGTNDQTKLQKRFELLQAKRENPHPTTTPIWHGAAVKPGLPLPGDNRGFAGTLATGKIPASHAFLTGLLWFLILIVAVASVITLTNAIFAEYCRLNPTKSERFAYFRNNWPTFVASAVLRATFIGFFMIMSLALFQLSLGGPATVVGICSIVFLAFFVGMCLMMGCVLFYHKKTGRSIFTTDRLLVLQIRILGCVPWYRVSRGSRVRDERLKILMSVPWWRTTCEHNPNSPHPSQLPPIHEDERFLRRFGWLSARFRPSRWWFSALWVGYEFIRACFVGAGSINPLTQVFGLLAVECIALLCSGWLRPFESTRINALMVYLLGINKVSTVALSSLFDPRFNLGRTTATIIGFVIIIIQGLLTICLLIFIVIGLFSSHLSLTRFRREQSSNDVSDLVPFSQIRKSYMSHIERTSRRSSLSQPQKPSEDTGILRKPSFHVYSVQRCPKIEDESKGISGVCHSDALSFPTYIWNGPQSLTLPKHHTSYFSSLSQRSSPSSCPHRAPGENSGTYCDDSTRCSPTPGSLAEANRIEVSLPLHEELADDPRWQAACYGSEQHHASRAREF